MEYTNYIIKNGFGKHSSLDKSYKTLIRNAIIEDRSSIDRWEIYNLVISELIKADKTETFEMMKYKVTGGENINKVLLDVIHSELDVNFYMQTLIEKIEDYYDADWLKKYYQ